MREAKPRRAGERWLVRLTDEYGKRRKRLFDTHANAVRAQVAEQARVADVKAGPRDPTPADRVADQAFDYWEEVRVPQKRSGADDVSILKRHLRPFFGSMKLKDIGRAETDRYQIEKQKLDRKTVANHLTLLVAVLNLAVDLGWLVKPPRIKKPKLRLFNTDYRYLRTKEELSRFLIAALEEGELVAAMYATAVYTGLRAGELAGLRWDCVSFEQRLITVQFSFEGPTKSEDVRYVPILDPLLPVLKQWRLRCPGQLVFPNQWGSMQCESARIFQEIFHRVLDAAKFPVREVHGKTRRYIVFHDLRHTFASHWVMGGGDIFKLQKILGHKSMVMTQRRSDPMSLTFSLSWVSPVGSWRMRLPPPERAVR
jgi:integrase